MMGVAGMAIQSGFDAAQSGLSYHLQNRQAEKQRAWMEKMRSSQHQTAVTDMRAAGLNPLLMMGKSGPAKVAGAGGTGSAPSHSTSAAGATAGIKAAALSAQVDALEAATAKDMAQGRLSDHLSQKVALEGELVRVNTVGPRIMAELYESGSGELIKYLEQGIPVASTGMDIIKKILSPLGRRASRGRVQAGGAAANMSGSGRSGGYMAPKLRKQRAKKRYKADKVRSNKARSSYIKRRNFDPIFED